MKRTLPKIICAVVIIMVLFTMHQAGEVTSFAAENPAKNAKKSVVRIATCIYYDGEFEYISYGSGVCVGQNPVEYIITNKHVVEGDMLSVTMAYFNLSEQDLLNMSESELAYYYLQLDSSKVESEVFVVADDALYELSEQRGLVLSNADLALLHLKTTISSRQAIAFGDTDVLESMDKVYALGYPAIAEKMDDRSADSVLSGIEDLTVTDGIISRKNVIMEGVTYIQHTADINHGNSGGPLIDETGSLIGVNTLGWGDDTSSVYFAIDISEVTRFLKQNNISWSDAAYSNLNTSSTATSAIPSVSQAQKEPLAQIPFTSSVAYFKSVPFSSASASSELSSGGIVFKAGYAIDNSSNEGKKRPWIEGTSGDGVGESLSLQFGKSQSIRLLAFDLGYASDQFHYFRNSRPSKLLLRFSDGSKLECSFEDSFSTQYVYFNRPIDTTYVDISILSVYTRCTEDGAYFYEDRDTGIFLVRAYEE